MRRFAALTSGLLVGIYACVGSDPGATNTPDDAAADSNGDNAVPDGGNGGDATPDVRVPTCAGQTFGTPVPISLTGGVNTNGLAWGMRRRGNTVYFSGGGAANYDLYRADFVGTTATAAVLLTATSSTTLEDWAPVVSPNGAFLLFARGPVGSRQIEIAQPSGQDFTASTTVNVLNSTGDDADPWIVGATTPTAVYFGHADQGSNDQRVWRAPITDSTPTFGTPQPVALPCPAANCGTPVTTAAEDTLFVAAWAAGGFVPAVHEGRLTNNGGAVSISGMLVPHPELGQRYVSWSSADGCEVLLGTLAVADLAIATRTPQ